MEVLWTLAAARYNARVSHPVHVVTGVTLDQLAEWDRPVRVGALVTVDTAVPVDVPAVAAAVRDGQRRLSEPGGRESG